MKYFLSSSFLALAIFTFSVGPASAAELKSSAEAKLAGGESCCQVTTTCSLADGSTSTHVYVSSQIKECSGSEYKRPCLTTMSPVSCDDIVASALNILEELQDAHQ